VAPSPGPAPDLFALTSSYGFPRSTWRAHATPETVSRPRAAYVDQRNLDPGGAVSGQRAGTSTSSVGILTTQDIETAKVQIEVPERDVARVRVGSPVRLAVDPVSMSAVTPTRLRPAP
jgi:hypothetical protein